MWLRFIRRLFGFVAGEGAGLTLADEVVDTEGRPLGTEESSVSISIVSVGTGTEAVKLLVRTNKEVVRVAKELKMDWRATMNCIRSSFRMIRISWGPLVERSEEGTVCRCRV